MYLNAIDEYLCYTNSHKNRLPYKRIINNILISRKFSKLLNVFKNTHTEYLESCGFNCDYDIHCSKNHNITANISNYIKLIEYSDNGYSKIFNANYTLGAYPGISDSNKNICAQSIIRQFTFQDCLEIIFYVPLSALYKIVAKCLGQRVCFVSVITHYLSSNIVLPSYVTSHLERWLLDSIADNVSNSIKFYLTFQPIFDVKDINLFNAIAEIYFDGDYNKNIKKNMINTYIDVVHRSLSKINIFPINKANFLYLDRKGVNLESMTSTYIDYADKFTIDSTFPSTRLEALLLS